MERRIEGGEGALMDVNSFLNTVLSWGIVIAVIGGVAYAVSKLFSREKKSKGW